MGKIHVLPEHVANKIAAGEVVERPASVVKELLENALDAGARRIRVRVEAGGRRLIQVEDDGSGMVYDDAMLAFERHATSKIRDAEDLLNIHTLGFRGEALPSIGSVSRLRLETAPKEQDPSPSPRNGTPLTGDRSKKGGTVIEIAGGRMLKVEEAGLPGGTSITVKDLFFNTPARRKFLKSESTELGHIAALVTQYALAHPDKHFELHSATNAMLVAPPVKTPAERIYQVFGKDTLEQLIPLAAQTALEHVGLPQPPRWKRDEQHELAGAGEIRVHGFVSKPELQKLNRNSIFVFVNGRLIRDRLIQHALTEAYRNIIPPTVFPVVLLFIELPHGEVDANVHPSKVEVRFRQQSVVHDFVRDSVRAALIKARPVPQFTREIAASPRAAAAFLPGDQARSADIGGFSLRAPQMSDRSGNLAFSDMPIEVQANAAVPVARWEAGAPLPSLEQAAVVGPARGLNPDGNMCAGVIPELPEGDVPPLSSLKPLGQLRDSFILAVNENGLWIIDQHVAHERVLFEKVLRQRAAEEVETQRLLMPLIIELTPGQQAVFAEIAGELRYNGFDAEPFGSRTIAVKTSPAGIETSDVEQMLHELLDQVEREQQATNLEKVRAKIAASISCHAAIKVNMALTAEKMEWLIKELAKCDNPVSCPHGRPVLLRYSLTEIKKAFKRI